jgi:ribosomal protein L24
MDLYCFVLQHHDASPQVQVIAGKEAGKQGTIVKVYRKEQKLLIASLNLVSASSAHLSFVL